MLTDEETHKRMVMAENIYINIYIDGRKERQAVRQALEKMER